MRYARFTAGDHWSPLQAKVKFVRKIRVKSVRKIRVRSVRREYANYSKTRQFYTTYSPCSCRGDHWSPASLSIAPTKSKPLSLAQTLDFPQSPIRRENPSLSPLKRFWGFQRPFPKRVFGGVRGSAPRVLPASPKRGGCRDIGRREEGEREGCGRHCEEGRRHPVDGRR